MSGSTMILVLWISFSLVCSVLGYGSIVVLENRQTADAVAAIQAEQALRGAQAYVQGVLATIGPGKMPLTTDLPAQEFTIGEATFQLVRMPGSSTATEVEYGVEAESGRLNLNNVPAETLQLLPGMTMEAAAAIVDWRDVDETPGSGGAESETYLRLKPPRLCKNTPFESLGELAMVYGMTDEILYGRDRNLNGLIDSWEKEISANGDFGLFRYVTVFSKSTGPAPDGSAQVSVNSNQLRQVLQSKLSADNAEKVLAKIQPGRTRFSSLLDFYEKSGLDQTTFATIEPYLTATESTSPALINVNSAPVGVLATLAGLDDGSAESLVAWRKTNPDSLASITWILNALDKDKAAQAAARLTTSAWQIRADISATGANGRGFRRRLMIFDTSSGTPVISYSRDITGFGWAASEKTTASKNSLTHTNSSRQE